ncbi:MAG TPA: hypothetical protein DD417_00415, partial [Elusimicrobia bacterium]|nr:hypothetical protein [Elusimicrobiota bacterium]
MRTRIRLFRPLAGLLAVLIPGALRAASTEPFVLPPPPAESSARYRAEEFEYQGSTTGADAEVFLRGNVELRESTWTLRADELRLDMNRRWAEARGGFEIDDGLTVLRGESGSFDLEEHTGSVAEVRAEYPPWRIWASTGTLDAAGKGHFRRAVFTSCSAAPPHYHFRSSRLHLKPKKWMTATHVRFYVGKVPLFYSPFLWKSLRPKKVLHTRVIPGYDRRNGGWLRTNTMFSISPVLYGKIFLDYYTAQGFGAGSELEYHPSEDGRGALYGYRVREQHNGDERWTVLGSHYQSFGSSWAVQGRLQAQSDPEVNNHYLRSNAFRVTTELVNGAALLRRTA